MNYLYIADLIKKLKCNYSTHKNWQCKEADDLIKIFTPFIKNVVKSFSYRLFKSETELEGVSQDIWVEVWKDLLKLKNNRAFPSWVCGVTKNCCLSRLKRYYFNENNKKVKIVPIEIVDGKKELLDKRLQINESDLFYASINNGACFPHPLDDMEFIELSGLIDSILDEQVAGHGTWKKIFWLYANGKKHKETADQLGISEGSVKTAIYRMKPILQVELQKRFGWDIIT